MATRATYAPDVPLQVTGFVSGFSHTSCSSPAVYCYYRLHEKFVKEQLGCQQICKDACR